MMLPSQEFNAGLLQSLNVRPRDCQLDSADKVISAFVGIGDSTRPLPSVLLESPTGSGKTVMGLIVARWMQQHLGYSVGWSAIRRNLLSQVQRENRSKGFDAKLTTSSMFDCMPSSVDLLVVDEAQHDAALSMARIHERIRPKKILGLSATPFRGDQFTLCFDRVVREVSIESLMRDGHLSTFEHFTIPEYTPHAVAECFGIEPNRWGQSVVFFREFSECEACAPLLKDMGIHAEIVTAESDRERQIQDLIKGRIEVLLSMMNLTEGFDCQVLKTVFCRPSGKLYTIQMCGRVLRKSNSAATRQCARRDGGTADAIAHCLYPKKPISLLDLERERTMMLAPKKSVRFAFVDGSIGSLSATSPSDGKEVEIRLRDDTLVPTSRFWDSLFRRYRVPKGIFRLFNENEVFRRIHERAGDCRPSAEFMIC